ncbi:hypothetical protein GLOTRDRAFT_38343 [Gloeophyllum trabeum ATCC 11539]|uniref:DNA glycosylase n=1 Tax=Gloeophyllum trabeum (strain ATCC 11539 / FP-39264 / Madison 617) TaxID=670483 RepID=S7QEF5_GLOTA|nr:uncharacterized protein GLOTRDRAFT_38343 [Gloeophyllum trabeum ATCC 11539]EPQ57693.1 hypothetical protein GLOTRDRAFT_38343 [Gloeophyllum trabeum ATCC 11539]
MPKEDVSEPVQSLDPKPRATKRKAAADTTTARQKKARNTAKTEAPAVPAPSNPVVPTSENGAPQAFVPAVLTFSFEDAKKHLISVDPRFEDIFERLKCKPFEHLERVDPFRYYKTVTLRGQQISWLAARSITHRFRRLFDPSLPEKPDHAKMNDADSFFPTAQQVAQSDVATLRTAGLSQRKAEYGAYMYCLTVEIAFQDLASRFADGRLSTQKLLEAGDEELYELLTAVRGIGRLTCSRYSRCGVPTSSPSVSNRPCSQASGGLANRIPGDLGVQRGLIRWFLSLHNPSYTIDISPQKLPKAPDEKEEEETGGPSDALTPSAPTAFPPVPALPETPKKNRGRGKAKATESDDDDDLGPLPPPFTPSINRTLNARVPEEVRRVEPLPEGLTVAVLKSRLDGKKKIKGAMLTPQEMEELTKSWRPYRSLGVYYMWSLAEGTSA